MSCCVLKLSALCRALMRPQIAPALAIKISARVMGLPDVVSVAAVVVVPVAVLEEGVALVEVSVDPVLGDPPQPDAASVVAASASAAACLRNMI